jgi:hypothetical protein
MSAAMFFTKVRKQSPSGESGMLPCRSAPHDH